MKSGPNQHFIPAFVQRPFGIPPNRRDIWYFERNKQPEKRAIKRAGSENHFYSEPASTTVSTLDDEITKVEDSLSQILSSIRSIPMGGSVDPHDAASIVAHLALRTAHFRDSLKHGLSQLFDQAKVIFADADNLQAIAGLDHPAPNDRFREHVLSDLLERPGISELNWLFRVFSGWPTGSRLLHPADPTSPAVTSEPKRRPRNPQIPYTPVRSWATRKGNKTLINRELSL